MASPEGHHPSRRENRWLAAEVDGPEVLRPLRVLGQVVPPRQTSCCCCVPLWKSPRAQHPEGLQQMPHTTPQAAEVIKTQPWHFRHLCCLGDKFSGAHPLGSHPCCHQHFTADMALVGERLA